MLAQEEPTNTTAWQIYSLEKFFVKIKKNPKRVLFMILDMKNIYIKYLN